MYSIKYVYLLCFGDCAAFDCVDRTLLLYALQNAGIEGHFLKVIKAMYTDTQCVVKVNNKVTDWFPTYAGVRQGQNESPTIFAVFINS